MVDFKKNPELDVFKSELVQGAFFSKKYEFPLLKRVDYKPARAIPFDKAAKSIDTDQWIHFYMHDRNFECVWNKPKQYAGIFRRFKGVITPDYSLYREMPLAMQIWNTYRNRALAYWMQNMGVPVIPNIRWGDERTYDFAFEGIEPGGTVAVSTNGCIQNRIDREYFKKGLAEMVARLQPQRIVNYSYTPEDIFGAYSKQGIEIVSIENYSLTVRKDRA